MNTELYRVLKEIDEKKLSNDDMEELLGIFMITKNELIRNHLSFIFADLQYDKAVPYIITKINEASVSHNNGSLVYSLSSFDMKEYFIDLIKIICTQEYEARLMAFEIVQKSVASIPSTTKNIAVQILEEQRVKSEETATDKGENSTLHFVEKAMELLEFSI
jgi:hypothetical protein